VRLGWRPRGDLELGVLLHDLLQERHEEFGLSAAPVTNVERGVHASLTWTF